MQFRYIILLVGFLFCYYMFIPFRLVVKNPFSTVYYVGKDLYECLIPHLIDK